MTRDNVNETRFYEVKLLVTDDCKPAPLSMAELEDVISGRTTMSGVDVELLEARLVDEKPEAIADSDALDTIGTELRRLLVEMRRRFPDHSVKASIDLWQFVGEEEITPQYYLSAVLGDEVINGISGLNGTSEKAMAQIDEYLNALPPPISDDEINRELAAAVESGSDSRDYDFKKPNPFHGEPIEEAVRKSFYVNGLFTGVGL